MARDPVCKKKKQPAIMNDFLNNNEYRADQTRIAILKTYRESMVLIFNEYPDALRLFSSFAERTVVSELNDTLLVIEEVRTIHIPVSSEGAVNALATGPTFEKELTAIQLRFYKNQFDVDEKVINSPTAQAETRLSMLAIVFAVELQSALEIFRALRSAPHALDAVSKKLYWQNMLRQIGSGMLRENDDTEGAAHVLQLRNLILTSNRDFTDIPHDQLFGLIIDWQTAGSIGITGEISNQNDLLKIANSSLLKTTSPLNVGGVIVESIPPYYRSMIQQNTALTLEYTSHVSFAGFVPVAGNPAYENQALRVYIPDYNGGARYITVPAGAAGHDNQNLLVVIRDVAIRGSSHIVVFGRDKPVAIAESASTNVRGGPEGAIDPRNGMGYVSASRFVGATCIRRRNVVELMARIVASMNANVGDEAKLADLGNDLTGDPHNVFVLRTGAANFLPTKDIFDLVDYTNAPAKGLFDRAKLDQFWNGKKLGMVETNPLGFALTMPLAVSLNAPSTAAFTTTNTAGPTPVVVAGPSLVTNTFLNFSPCKGPGLTLAGGVEGQYQGMSTISVPSNQQLREMYASSYRMTLR